MAPPPAIRWCLLPIGLAGWVVVLSTAFSAPAARVHESGPDRIYVPGVVRELAVRFAAADRLAAEARWQEAVDAYLEIARQQGDDLAPIDPAHQPLASGQRFLQARWLVSLRIAQLGPPAWKACRHRLDAPADKQLELALQTRDKRLLRRIVDEAFCSRAGARALEELGDAAFERGDFDEAQYWWRLLVVPASAPNDADVHSLLIYPDTPVATKARVRAKQIVALLFQQRGVDAAAELKAYRAAHGVAQGRLAGQAGAFADIVQMLADQGQGARPPAEQDWPTFAGAASRNRPLPLALSPKLWQDGPAWRVRLESGELLPVSQTVKTAPVKPSPLPSPRQLAVYPAIAGNLAHVADARFVRGYHLRTGRLAYQYDLLDGRAVAGADELPSKFPLAADARFSVTAAEGRVFARLGGPWFGPGGKRTESWLVCLQPHGPAPAPFQRWAVAAAAKDADQVAFEGAPLVHGGGAYIVRSRLEGTRTCAALCCFAAETGELRWELELCEVPEFADGVSMRSRQHLLTLAGPLVIYSSNAGAVVAVEAASGKIHWAVRYESRGQKTRPREFCPPAAADNRVYLAPADAERLSCLDVVSGRTLWERDAVEVVHLFGVSHGQVLFTIPGGLRALNATTGNDLGGWRQPSVGGLAGCGRGLLADGWVWWPTVDPKLPWRTLSVLDGSAIRGSAVYEPGRLVSLALGHLAYGHGCLVIATDVELLGYVPAPELGVRPQT